MPAAMPAAARATIPVLVFVVIQPRIYRVAGDIYAFREVRHASNTAVPRIYLNAVTKTINVSVLSWQMLK